MAYIELSDKQLLKAMSSSLDESDDHLLMNGLIKIMIKNFDWDGSGLDYDLVEKLSDIINEVLAGEGEE